MGKQGTEVLYNLIRWMKTLRPGNVFDYIIKMYTRFVFPVY